jgi:hypothetical protein
VADSALVSYLAVSETKEARAVPDRGAWHQVVAEQMLEASQCVAHTHDDHLSRHVALVKEGSEEREKLQQ